jgi:predicted kinase
MQRLVIVGGWPGAGKTWITNKYCQLAGGVHLDKDVCTSSLSELSLELLGSNRSDRESLLYLSKVREVEYQALWSIVKSVVEQGNQTVLVSAPFYDVFQLSHDEIRSMLNIEIEVIKLWVHSDENSRKNRIKNRMSHRDHWKINNWSEYEAGCNTPVEANCDHLIDNSLWEKDALRNFITCLEVDMNIGLTNQDIETIYSLSI